MEEAKNQPTTIDDLISEYKQDYHTTFWTNQGIGAVKELELNNAMEEVDKRFKQAIDAYYQERFRQMIDGNTSNELYEFRKLYNAALFNEWARQGKYNVHKSLRHSDGERCFGGGWFIVMANLPTGQISNHYEQKDWDIFRVESRERANEWDGHTPQDVATRLQAFLELGVEEEE